MVGVEIVLEAGADVGEAPVWVPEDSALLWVDITRGEVHRFHPSSGVDELIATMSEMVGAVVPRAAGGMMAATERGFVSLAADGTGELLVATEADLPTNRMNDGACDPVGRFFAGTMAFDVTPDAGKLYRLDADLQVHEVLQDVTLSNGLGWSPDARVMYFIDSATGRLDAFDYNLEQGSPTRRRPLVAEVTDKGMPDGLAVDAEGGIWVAIWGGSCLRRYTPDGALDVVIDLPASQITSCAFGGERLDVLYVTSAAYELDSKQLQAEPLAGALFALDVGVAGLPSHPCSA